MKKKVCAFLIFILLFSGLALAGCGTVNDDAAGDGDLAWLDADIASLEGPDLKFTPEDFPVIDGATALAPYYEAMAAQLLGMDIAEARQHVLCSMTDGAYVNLIEHRADMIFCSMPSSELQEMADKAGFEFEMTPFLNGGFVFFVNENNPVDSLTIEQLHDIYAGKITNWKEVGGKDMEIIAYQRPNNSGSQTGLYAYVIDEDEVMEAPSHKIMAGMGDIVDAVSVYENSEGAIGYSYYYYVTSMNYSDKIKLMSIDGIAPSDATIADGTYPIINPSYVIIDADTPEDSPIREIVAWITSQKGLATGKQAGYVPRLEAGLPAEE